MENATKALIIAASTLIAVMIFAFMWYVFQRFALFSESTENRGEDLVIQKFNSQFSAYDTSGAYNIDSFGSDSSTASNTTTEVVKKRYMAAKELNPFSNVMTAINLAVTTNYTNNNEYRYEGLEMENAVEVIIDLSNINSKIGVSYKYYLVEPNANIAPNTVYGTNTQPDYEDKEVNVKNFTTANPLSTYELLTKTRESKTTIFDNKTYTIYRYYFVCDYHTNEKTQKIDSIRFKAIEDKGFDLV